MGTISSILLNQQTKLTLIIHRIKEHHMPKISINYKKSVILLILNLPMPLIVFHKQLLTEEALIWTGAQLHKEEWQTMMHKRSLEVMETRKQFHQKSSSRVRRRKAQKSRTSTQSCKEQRQFQVIWCLEIMHSLIWEMKWKGTSWADSLSIVILIY